MNSIQLNLNSIVDLELNLDLIKLNSNTLNGFQFYIGRNWHLSLQQHLEVFFNSTMIFVVSLFFNVFSLGVNKKDLGYVTHCIISSLPFGWNFSFSKLFQHFMSLTYEHEMSFLCLGMNIFFLLHYDLHLVKVLNTKWRSPHYVCIMWKKWLKKLMDQKMKNVLFSSFFPLCS